ncbi:MAG: NAD(P)-dependent oxidoreductase, partial [Pseudomonadota bacterium]
LPVRAIVRRDCGLWRDTPGVETVVVDLGTDDPEALDAALTGAGSVIHLATSLGGDAEAQRRDTARGTDALLIALGRQNPAPTLVLASSFSVYGYADLPVGAVIYEATPLEPRPDRRDAYCRGKLEQEAKVRAASRPAWILRPGAVFGPDRLWNAHLGLGAGPAAIVLGGDALVPTAWVEHVAEALLRAAETPPSGVEVVNVIDDDLPDQMTYVRAYARSGWPKRILRAPVWPLAAVGAVLGLVPGLSARGPGLFRPDTRAARLRPFRYDNGRLKARLGWRPAMTFEEAMDRAIAFSRSEDWA